MTKKSGLLGGSHARVYRNGELVSGSVVPTDSRLELRNLLRGSYEVRDEAGNVETFELDSAADVCFVPVAGVKDSIEPKAPEPEPGEAEEFDEVQEPVAAKPKAEGAASKKK